MYPRPAEFDKMKIQRFDMMRLYQYTSKSAMPAIARYDGVNQAAFLYLTRYTHKDSSLLSNSDCFENSVPSSN